MTDSIQPVRVSAMQRVRITLGVAAFGGVAGALAGGISALLVDAIVDRNLRALLDWFVFVIGAEIGAPLGAVLLPIAAWTLMRHVSFGRAFIGTVAGTLMGGLAGWFIARDAHVLFRSVAGGIIGFSVAATLLRLRAGTTEENVS